MSVAFDGFCLVVPLEIPVATALSTDARVGGWGWSILMRAVRSWTPRWQFLNSPPSWAPIADDMTCCRTVHSMCMGAVQKLGMVVISLFLGFGPRKKCLP